MKEAERAHIVMFVVEELLCITHLSPSAAFLSSVIQEQDSHKRTVIKVVDRLEGLDIFAVHGAGCCSKQVRLQDLSRISSALVGHRYFFLNFCRVRCTQHP